MKLTERHSVLHIYIYYFVSPTVEIKRKIKIICRFLWLLLKPAITDSPALILLEVWGPLSLKTSGVKAVFLSMY